MGQELDSRVYLQLVRVAGAVVVAAVAFGAIAEIDIPALAADPVAVLAAVMRDVGCTLIRRVVLCGVDESTL